MVMAPVPAKQSSTVAPSQLPRNIEKSDSFTRSGIGRVVPESRGVNNLRDRYFPEIMRMM